MTEPGWIVRTADGRVFEEPIEWPAWPTLPGHKTVTLNEAALQASAGRQP